ncbi:hypothetical protein KX816_05575 [Sphingosinicellaceae bacterium]|nr:hypothetical protein KX816_05575 [Sphingosinicellaceae bacterium]
MTARIAPPAGTPGGNATLCAAPSLPAADPPGRSEYRVLAAKTPQYMLRILGLFAQQDQLPDRLRMDVVEDMIWVALTIDGLTRHRADVIAQKLRALVDTEAVDLSWTGDVRRCKA